MYNNFVNALRDEFEQSIIDANNINIQRVNFGFVINDCEFIKSILRTICLQAIDNIDIFNDVQKNNVVVLINKLSHG